MDPSREDFRPPVGSRVGAYELVRVVGEGCFGVVYLARGIDGSEVALKLLRGTHGHQPEVFEGEKHKLEKARSATGARVVCLVEGWQEEAQALGGCYCLAMTPCCSGGSLEALIEGRAEPVALRTRLRWALEVAETLQLLHSTPSVRLYHGDVTPRNVALHAPCRDGGDDRQEEAYLLDLGVSKHNHPHGMTDPLKQQSASVAPEMDEEGAAFDASADVWSWAVLLYVLLSWSLGTAERWGGARKRDWFASLPEQPRDAWEHELRLGAGEDEEETVREAVVVLMLDCFRGREERAGMEAVVHVMRWALGYHEAPTQLVYLDEELRRARAGGGMAPEAEAKMLLRKAQEHYNLSQHVDDRICCERAIRLCRGLPAHQLLLAHGLNILAWLNQCKGEYDRALPMYEEALAIRRSALPPVHDAIATSLNNLALQLQKMGEYDRALSLFMEALAMHKLTFSNYSDIATCISNIARVYEIKGAFHLALPLFDYALAMQLAMLPSRHPDIARTFNNLAAVHQSMGEYDRALPLYKKALDMDRELYPADHERIAQALHNMAVLHKRRGRPDLALPLYEEALEMRKAALPEGHPDTASSFNSLGTLYKDMGDYDRALPLYQEALAIRRSALPPVHESTARTLHNLGSLYDSKGEYDQAMALYEEALAMRRAALPEGHQDIATTLNSIALLNHSRGDYARALQLLEEAVAPHEIALVEGLDVVVRVRTSFMRFSPYRPG